jgi:Concanavalin A-like lectin/glucanases superfamily/HYR domain/Immunoglobulin domain
MKKDRTVGALRNRTRYLIAPLGAVLPALLLLLLAGPGQAQPSNSCVPPPAGYGATNSAGATLTVLANCTPPPAGLVSWWAAEGTALDSVGTNNGVLLNGVGFGAGEVGQAFIFNGTNSYVGVADSPSLRLTNELTVEFWVKRQDLQREDYILNKGGDYIGGQLNYGVTLTQPLWGGTLAFTFAGGARHSLSITDTNWHHCAVTARNGEQDPTFYVDGAQRAVTLRQGAANINLYASPAPLLIGAQVDPASGWSYYSGARVDELGIYNRVLGAAEIQALYNAGSAGKCRVLPSIQTQPRSQTVVAGTNMSFNVVASGSAPLSYQWHFNGASIPGATTSVLALSNAQPANAGTYYVAVANPYGATNSVGAVLTVLALKPPEIIAQPQDQRVVAGSNATFSVTATGATPYSVLSYQWYFNGGALSGATTSSLALHGVMLSQAGSYSVRLTNLAGSVTSRSAVLAVVGNGLCSAPPAGLVSWWAGEGTAADLAGTNNGRVYGAGFGAGEVGQAFSFNGTTQFVMVPYSRSLAATNYSVEAWVKPLSQVSDVISQDLIVGQAYGWHLVARAGGSGVDVAFGFGTSMFDFYDVASTSELPLGQFSHLVGTWDGMTLRLYINGVLNAQRIVAATPVDLGYGVYIGGFYVQSGSDVIYSGQYFNGLIDEAGYYNQALSAGEIANIYLSGSAGKCKPVPPSIASPPQDQTVLMGSNATFTVTAVGTPPLLYQWFFGSSPIAGATTTALNLRIVGMAQAGSYSVVVSNYYGTATGGPARLTVVDLVPPFIIACASNRTVSAGANCAAVLPDLTGEVVAFDASGPVSVTQDPSPGTALGLGANTVTLTARDSSSNAASCTSTFTVVDTTPPTLSCPASKVLEFQDEHGAVATFSVTASDPCSAVCLVVNPPSGSVFPIGVTPVLARAMDASSNTTQGSFTVTVLGAQGVKSNVLAQLSALQGEATLTGDFSPKFADAIQHLASSLSPAYWVDQTHLQARGGNTAMNEEKLSAGKLLEIMQARKCPVDPAILQGFVDRIVRCDRLLAVICIQEAARAGLNPRKVAEDLDMVAKGDAEAAAGNCDNAIEQYRNAWRHALQLRLQVGVNPDGTTLLQFVGNNSQPYRIEVSGDMVHWALLGTCAADADGNVQFTDPNTASHPLRFYRAVEQ